MQYTQTVEHAFHVSMAAVEPETDKEKLKQNRFVSLMLRHNKAEFLICTLEHNRLLQQPLELNFCQGEHVSFYLNGSGVVHLTGYMLDDDDDNIDLSDADSVESLEDEDVEEELTGKRKKEGKKLGSNKRAKVDDEDEDSDDDCEEENNYEDEDDDDEEEEEEDDEDERKDIATRIDFCSDSSAEEEANSIDSSRKKKKKDTPKNKSKNQLVETPNKSLQKGQTPSSTGKKAKRQVDSASYTKVRTPSGSTEKPQKPAKRVLEGSIVAEDMKLGHGPEAKAGKMVHVYYVGRIHSTGKLFDSTVGSRPFKFRLGKNEVIKGWDVGLCGMKVGGKRKLVIPPRMGYGSQRIGPIPPNSTLSFEIELKAVS